MKAQRPYTALQDNRNQQQKQHKNSNRPQTSLIQNNFTGGQQQNNNTNKNYSIQHRISQSQSSAYLHKYNHKRNSQSQSQLHDYNSSQYSQQIGDEGERLDQEQLQLQDLITDINKKRPQQQRVDKEKLYEEAINLNNFLYGLQDEQRQLDEKLQDVEEEKFKNQKLIMDVEEFIIQQKGAKIKGQQSQLVLSLKKQLEQLQDRIEQEQHIIQKTTKSPLYTKQKEFEIQTYMFKEQTEQYRQALVETKKENRKVKIEIEKLKKQQNPNYIMKKQHTKGVKITEADVLQQQVYDQRALMKIFEYQNDLLLSKKYSEERNVQTSMLNIKSLREKLQRKENLYESMVIDRDQLIDMERKKKQKQKELEQKQQKLKKTKEQEENSFMINPVQQQTSQVNDTKQQLAEKIVHIEKQEQQIQKLEAFLEERANKENEQKKQMSNKIAHLREVISNLEDKLDNLDNALEEELQHIPIDHLPRFGKGQYTEVFTINNDILRQEQQTTLKKVPKVCKDDLEISIKELQYRLRIKNISIEKALQRIIPDKISLRGIGTIQDMQSILMRAPFSIYDGEEALVMARYLVEDNQSDFVDLDITLSQQQEVIRSIFKNLLGSYQLYSNQEEFSLWEDISKIITKYGQGLQQQAYLYPGYEETGMLCPRDIRHCFNNVIEIPEHKIDYILMRLFEQCNSYKMMEFSKILEIFKTGCWMDKNSRKHTSKVIMLDEMKQRFRPAAESEDMGSDSTRRERIKQFKQDHQQDSHEKHQREQSPLETQNDKLFQQI